MAQYPKQILELRLNLQNDMGRIGDIMELIDKKTSPDYEMLRKDVETHSKMFAALDGKKNFLDYGKLKMEVQNNSKKWANKIKKMFPHVEFSTDLDSFNPMKTLDVYVNTLQNLIEKEGQAKKMTPGIMAHNEETIKTRREPSPPVTMINASASNEEEKIPHQAQMQLVSRPVQNAMTTDTYSSWLKFMQQEYPDVPIHTKFTGVDKARMDTAKWMLYGTWQFASDNMKDAGVDFMGGETLRLANKIDFSMLQKNQFQLFSTDGDRKFKQSNKHDVKTFMKHWLDDASQVFKDPRFTTALLQETGKESILTREKFASLWHMFKLGVDIVGKDLEGTNTGLNTKLAMRHLDQINGAAELRRLAQEQANGAFTENATFDPNPTSFGMNFATKWQQQAPSYNMPEFTPPPAATSSSKPADMLDMTMGQLKKHLQQQDELEDAARESDRLGLLSQARMMFDKEKNMSEEEQRQAVEHDAQLEQDMHTYEQALRYYNSKADEEMSNDRQKLVQMEENRHKQQFSSSLNQVNIDLTGLNQKEQTVVNGALNQHYQQQTQRYIDQTANLSRDELQNRLDKALDEADASFVPVAPKNTAVVIPAQSQLLTIAPTIITGDATMRETTDPERVLTDQEIDQMPSKFRRAAREARNTSKPPNITIATTSKNIGKIVDTSAKITGLMQNIKKRDQSSEAKTRAVVNNLKAKANIREQGAEEKKQLRKENLAESAMQMGNPQLAQMHLQQPEVNNADYSVQPPDTVDVSVFDDEDMTVSVPIFAGQDALTNQRVIAAKEYFASGQTEQQPVEQNTAPSQPTQIVKGDDSTFKSNGETYYEYTPEQPAFSSQQMQQTVNVPMAMAAPENQDSEDEYMSAEEELAQNPPPKIPEQPVQQPVVQQKQPAPILKAPPVPTLAPITSVPSQQELSKNKALADELANLFEQSYSQPIPQKPLAQQIPQKPAQSTIATQSIAMPPPPSRQPAQLQQSTINVTQIQNPRPDRKDGGTSPPPQAPHRAPVAQMIGLVDKMEILPPPPKPPTLTMTVHQQTAQIAAVDFEQQVSETIANFDGPETRLQALRDMREQASKQYSDYMEYKIAEKAKMEERKEQLQVAKLNFERSNKAELERIKTQAQKEKDEFKFWTQATASSKKFEQEVGKVYLEELKLVRAQENEERKLHRELMQQEARENMFKAKIEAEQKKLEVAQQKLYDRQKFLEQRRKDTSLQRAKQKTEDTRQRLISKSRELEAQYGFGRSAFLKKLDDVKDRLHDRSAVVQQQPFPKESSPPPNASKNQPPPVMPKFIPPAARAQDDGYSSLLDPAIHDAPPINQAPPSTQTTSMQPTTQSSSSIYNVPTQANPTLLQQAPPVQQTTTPAPTTSTTTAPTTTSTATTAQPPRGGRMMARTGGGGGGGGDDGGDDGSGGGRRPDRGDDGHRGRNHRGRSPPKSNSEQRKKLSEDRARDRSLDNAYKFMNDQTQYQESLRQNVKKMKTMVKDLAMQDTEMKKLREKYVELDQLKRQYDINHATALAEIASRPDLDPTIQAMISQANPDHNTLVTELKKFQTAQQLDFDHKKKQMNEVITTIDQQITAANYHSVFQQDKLQELNALVVKYGAERANIGMAAHNWPAAPTTQDLLDGLSRGAQEIKAHMDSKKQKMQDLSQITHTVNQAALERQSLDQQFALLKDRMMSNPSLANNAAFQAVLATQNDPDVLATNLKQAEIQLFQDDLQKKQAVKNAMNHAKNVDHFVSERTKLNEQIIADMKRTRDDLFKVIPNNEQAQRAAIPQLFKLAESQAGELITPAQVTQVEQQLDQYMRAQKIMVEGLKPKIYAAKKVADTMESIAELAASNELDMAGIKRRVNKDIDDVLTYFPNVQIQPIPDGVFDDPTQIKLLQDHVAGLKQTVLTHIRGGKLARENLKNTVNDVSVYAAKLKHLQQEETTLIHEGKMRLQGLEYANKTDIVGMRTLADIQAEDAKVQAEITTVHQNVINGRLSLTTMMNQIQTLKNEIKERKAQELSTAALQREVDKLTIEQNAIRASIQERQRHIDGQRAYYDSIALPLIDQRRNIAAAGHDIRRLQLVGMIDDPAAFDNYIAAQLANTSDAGAVEVLRSFRSDTTKSLQDQMYRNMLLAEEYYKPNYMAQTTLHKMADLFLKLGEHITKERYITMHRIAYLDDVTVQAYSPSEQERVVKERRDDVLKMGYLNQMMSHSNILFNEYRTLTQMVLTAQMGGGTMERNLKAALDNTGQEGVGRAVRAMMDDLQGNIVKMDRTIVGDVNNDKLARISNFLQNGMSEHMRKINSKIREMSADLIKNDSFGVLHNALTTAGRGLAMHFARAIHNNDNDMQLAVIQDMNEIQGMSGIANSLRDVVMNMGFQLYQGIDPAVNAARFSQDLGTSLNRIYAGRGHLNPQAINDLATETVSSLVTGMRADLVQGLIGKLQGSLAQAVQFLDAEMLSKFVGNDKDQTRSQILWDAGFIPPKTMENYRGWRESLINRMPQLVSLHERVTADQAGVLTIPQPGVNRQVFVRDRDEIREEMKQLAYNKFGSQDTPMRGFAVLGSHMGRTGGSMYDHPIAMSSFQANREMIRKRDPAQLQQTKNEMQQQRAALNDETGRVIGMPGNGMQMLDDMIPDFKKVLIRDILTTNNLGNARYITRNENQWDLTDRLCFDLDLLGNLNEAFVRIKTGIEHDKENLIPISQFRVTQLRALENLAHESINRVVIQSGRGRNGQIPQLTAPYQNRAQTINATSAQFTNEIRAKIQTEIQDSYNYNREYMDDQHVLMDLLEQEIVQQEARNGHWGKVNKVMDNTMNELQNRYMRNLQQFGLMDIQDPMIRQQQQQNILNTQQAMRHASQVSPYSYINQNRGLMSKSMANGGLGANASIADLRHARQMKGENKEAQKASNDGYEGNRRGDREKANETLSESLQISKKDSKLLRSLRKKKNGRLGIQDPKTGEKRELTDKEKLEVSRLLYAVAVAGLVQTMKNASQSEIEREKKKLKTMADDKSQQARLLDKIKNLIE